MPGIGACKNTPATDQLSLLSLRVNRVPACLNKVKAGAFTCVGWRAILCDSIWQVTLRSIFSELVVQRVVEQVVQQIEELSLERLHILSRQDVLQVTVRLVV